MSLEVANPAVGQRFFWLLVIKFTVSRPKNSPAHKLSIPLAEVGCRSSRPTVDLNLTPPKDRKEKVDENEVSVTASSGMQRRDQVLQQREKGRVR